MGGSKSRGTSGGVALLPFDVGCQLGSRRAYLALWPLARWIFWAAHGLRGFAFGGHGVLKLDGSWCAKLVVQCAGPGFE